MRRGPGAALALLALAAIYAPTATAAGPAIEQAGGAEFPQRSYTLHTPDPLSLEPGDVTVRENGEPVEDVMVESAAGDSMASFGTVLVIDASNSVRGRPIAAAMEAARAFAERRPPGQQLGVVAFNNDADVMLPMTTDPARIDEVLSARPPLDFSTALYDGVDTALAMLASSGVEAGSVVILTDGADNASVTEVYDVTARAEEDGVRIFAVALRSKRFDPATLEGLAVGGSVVGASSTEELTPILQRFGTQLASQYLVSYQSIADPGESVTVEVEVAGVSGAARDHYEAPRPASPPAKPADDGGFWGSDAALAAAIALAAGLLGFALFVLARPIPETARERLARFLVSGTARGAEPAARQPEAGLLASVARALEGRSWWTRLEDDLDIARIETPAVTVAAATVVGTALAFLFLVQLLDAPVLAPLALAVPFGVRRWIASALRKQRGPFADQLADNLQLVASALRAGQSMAGALAIVTDETSEPARGEFRRIVNDERLGVPLEDAIRDVARRMDNRDLEQVALVAKIQRETGGNTAEVLDQVIATIRERDKLRRLMKTLTSQGRLAQVIVSSLPLALLLIILLINRDYLGPLFETTGGNIALAIAAGLSVMGSMIIKRIVEVRV